MFLSFSILLLCSFFRLKELFQGKNGLTEYSIEKNRDKDRTFFLQYIVHFAS